MSQRQLTGSRIRQHRLDRQLQQSDLARAAGISGSYLNLIEHNRRRIGGKLLQDIARALGIDVTLLAEGAERGRIEDLRGAAAALPGAEAELGRAEEFAGRFPGWSTLIALQSAEIARLERQVDALSDRLAHDPQLATSLHAVISTVTSIRSTASILAGAEELDRDWQRRFHNNINEDSLRLADSARALVDFLEAPAEARQGPRSAAEELEAFLAALGHHLAALEGTEPALRPDEVARTAPGIDSPGGMALAEAHFRRYREDAQRMPLPEFTRAARACNYDPSVLGRHFDARPDAVLRRLAALPEADDHPELGLAICDAAGAITFQRPVAGFSLPRNAACCPLWPLFEALTSPGRPVLRQAALPGDPSAQFVCYAFAAPRGATGFGQAPVIEATMLVRPDPTPLSDAGLRVGSTCRLCPRPVCPARREASILTAS